NQQAANEPVYVSFFLATLAIVVTVTMASISHFAVNSFCEYCAMLWTINLAIWPCLVKQLGLGWGHAVGANAELLGGGKVNLRRNRVLGSFATGLVCVAGFSVMGYATSLGVQVPTDSARLVEDYDKAPLEMLPADSYGGPMSHGFSAATGAPVIDIVELADFQCPGCKMAGQFLKPFVLKHPDKVRVTFRNFPLDGSCNPYAPGGRHPVACAIARGSICAAKQNKFWEYHDEIYARQSEETSLSTITDVVKAIGMDEAAFDACVKSPETELALQKDMQLGDLVKLESTPTLIINGHKVVGGRPPAELEALLTFLESSKK
ncbi:MAG: thioredoxin domain-containing protein, partial [Bdellovibrionota bacterium]